MNRSWGKPVEPPSAPAVAAPGVCPGCGSASILTSAKVPDDNSYWRCTACGEIWNNARRQSPRQYRPPQRW